MIAATPTPNPIDNTNTSVMKPKRLKVYARLGLISTKLPIVKDLIEIITHGPM